MAVALKQLANVNPSTALLQATNDFKSSLTIDELQRFTKVLGPDARASDASSAMLLTSEIDAENAEKFSRYFGPRLMPLLEVVEQFSGIVETFVLSPGTRRNPGSVCVAHQCVGAWSQGNIPCPKNEAWATHTDSPFRNDLCRSKVGPHRSSLFLRGLKIRKYTAALLSSYP
jgi:hypothetical protein